MGAKGLTDNQVRELRTRRVVNHEPLAALAREFGISENHAYRLVIGDYRIGAGGPLYEPQGANWSPPPGAPVTELNAEDRDLALKLLGDGATPENVAAAMMCPLSEIQGLLGK